MNKKIISFVVSVVLILSLVACGNKNDQIVESNEPVIVPIMLKNAGNDSLTKLYKDLIKMYNEKYEGQYKLEVEWLPGVSEDFRAKLKMLNSAGDLPALVPELRAEPAFAELLIKNERLMDIKPYLDKYPEWKEMCIPESIEYNTTEDGKIFTNPFVTTGYIGIFYNKEHFDKAGLKEFPKTWDEFWEASDKLKAAGYTPLSLHTTETGWVPMLLGTSSFALTEEGKKFIKTKYPEDFEQDVVIDAMNIIKKAFGYSTEDAVGGNYALAANNFNSGKTSMIPNGPWMIQSLSDPQYAPEGFEEKVGYALFPGEVMLSNLGVEYGEGISMDHPLEVREGVIEWFRFLATPEVIKMTTIASGELSPKVVLTDEEKSNFSPAMVEYINAVEKIKDTVIVYQNKWDPITQNEIIPNELPRFITGDITVEEFCEKLSNASKKYKEDNK